MSRQPTRFPACVCWVAQNETLWRSIVHWLHILIRLNTLSLGLWTLPLISARPYGLRLSALQPPKPTSNFGSALAIRLFWRFFTKPQPKRRLGPAGLTFRASQMPRPHFFARSTSTLRSRTCCARLRPSRVSSMLLENTRRKEFSRQNPAPLLVSEIP